MNIRKKLSQFIWVIAMVLVVGQPTARAGTLRKLWELDLRKVVVGSPSPGARNLPVQLIRFSPDGRQLAVALAWDTSQKIFKSQLLVIDAQRAGGSAKQFEISAGIGNEELPGPTLFGWSPNGKVIFAGGKIIHLREGTTCEAPHGQAALIDDNYIILNQPDPYDAAAVEAQMSAIQERLKASGGRPIQFPPGPPERKSHLRLFDLECRQQEEEWEVAEEWDSMMSQLSGDWLQSHGTAAS